MNTKKIPMRKCLGCSESFPKKELIRIVLTPENELKMDASGRVNGRGCYICKKDECLKKAIKSRAVEKALKTEVSEDVIESLKKEMSSDE